jgi:glycosyltransferase involved in cell wall biosynthesis
LNILYYSAHGILEYDEIKLFTEMGHNVFSLGEYQNSNTGILRGSIPGLYDNHHLRGVAIQCSKENTHQELIDWADIVLLMHNARVDVKDHPQPWLKGNWKKFKASKKPIIWRGIGQSNAQVEKSLHEFRKDGLRIIRHSPTDVTIPYFAGADAVIRFYKDPDEYFGYVGQTPHLINLSQSLFGSDQVPSRGDHMCLSFFKQVVEGFDWKVFGPDNEKAGEHDGGVLSFEDLKQMLRFNRAFFYVGTRPANYTLSLIEAMMTGMPVVSIGPEHGNEIYIDQKTFEVHELLGEGGYWSDSASELRRHIAELLNNQQLAIELGVRGRARAIELFGKDTILREWDTFFKTL